MWTDWVIHINFIWSIKYLINITHNYAVNKWAVNLNFVASKGDNLPHPHPAKLVLSTWVVVLLPHQEQHLFVLQSENSY